MDPFITDAESVQEHVGRLPGPRGLKIIDFLDDHARRWIAASPLLFAAFETEQGPVPTIAGDTAGFVQVDDAHHLALPMASIDDSIHAQPGRGFASLLLVPGIGETLRVNGRVASVKNGQVRIAVGECYLHCAKALIRSGFWQAIPARGEESLDDAAGLTARCRFMALATSDGNGHLDVSPKGDPAGALLQHRDEALWYPDRPGNRIIDSFRNILMQPRIAALALLPGSDACLHLSGNAAISTDVGMREAFAVNGKVPKLVTRVAGLRLTVSRSRALAQVAPWSITPVAHSSLDPAAIFRDHVKLSRSRGVAATLVRAIGSVPGLVRKGLDADYEKNLY